MKKFLSVVICVSLMLTLYPYIKAKADTAGRTYYVDLSAPEGGIGNASRPLRTLSEVRDAIRQYLSTNPVPEGGINVMIAEGTYNFPETFTFTAEDSGDEGRPITYIANGEVIFTGATEGTAEAVTSVLNGSIIRADGASFIGFKGITFTDNLNAPLVSLAGDGITVDSCVFSNSGSTESPSDTSLAYALLGDGENISVKGCELFNVSGGISLSGGDRKTLSPSGNRIYNNYIHHPALSADNGAYAVSVDGVGAVVSHNEITDSASGGICFSGNDHVIEYNIVKNVTDGIVGDGSPTQYGNSVRYNHVSGVNGSGISVDGGMSGASVFGNVICDAAVGIHLGGGRDLTVENNIIICNTPVHGTDPTAISYKSSLRDAVLYDDGDISADHIWEFYDAHYDSGIWSERYPRLAEVKVPFKLSEVADVDDTALFFNPSGSVVRRNVFYTSKDIKSLSMILEGDKADGVPYQQRYGQIYENVLMPRGDMSDFPCAMWHNYTLSSKAKVFTFLPEFRDIPFNSMGRVGIKPLMKFNDVSTSDWFYPWVLYAFENGLMTGTNTDQTVFSPNAETSRAMIVQMLYNLEGKPQVEYSGVFTDVSEGDWYADAVIWAYENGVTAGTSDDTFSPNALVTREQAAVFLYRFMKDYKEAELTAGALLTGFPDSGLISPYEGFAEAVSWAVGEGIISGKLIYGKTYLAPTDSAKRCETAAMFARFYMGIAE